MLPLIAAGALAGGLFYLATSQRQDAARRPAPVPAPAPAPAPAVPAPAPTAPASTYAPAASGGTSDFDPKGLLNDERVHPKVREMAVKTANALQAQGFRPYLVEAYRTIADQRKAYERGFSKVLFGWHNTGLAIDVAHYNRAGTGPSGLGDDKALAARFWPAVGRAGLDAGFTEWGGNWKTFVDRPHLQYSPTKISLSSAKAEYDAGGISAVWTAAVGSQAANVSGVYGSSLLDHLMG